MTNGYSSTLFKSALDDKYRPRSGPTYGHTTTQSVSSIPVPLTQHSITRDPITCEMLGFPSGTRSDAEIYPFPENWSLRGDYYTRGSLIRLNRTRFAKVRSWSSPDRGDSVVYVSLYSEWSAGDYETDQPISMDIMINDSRGGLLYLWDIESRHVRCRMDHSPQFWPILFIEPAMYDAIQGATWNFHPSGPWRRGSLT